MDAKAATPKPRSARGFYNQRCGACICYSRRGSVCTPQYAFQRLRELHKRALGDTSDFKTVTSKVTVKQAPTFYMGPVIAKSWVDPDLEISGGSPDPTALSSRISAVPRGGYVDYVDDFFNRGGMVRIPLKDLVDPPAIT